MDEFLSAYQARAARAMLDLTRRQLAAKSKISESSIRRIENGFEAREHVTVDLCVKLREYFVERGFTFSWPDGATHCVCWNRKRVRRQAT